MGGRCFSAHWLHQLGPQQRPPTGRRQAAVPEFRAAALRREAFGLGSCRSLHGANVQRESCQPLVKSGEVLSAVHWLSKQSERDDPKCSSSQMRSF